MPRVDGDALPIWMDIREPPEQYGIHRLDGSTAMQRCQFMQGCEYMRVDGCPEGLLCREFVRAWERNDAALVPVSVPA